MKTLLSSYCLQVVFISSHIMWRMGSLINFAKMSQYFQLYSFFQKLNPEMWPWKSVPTKGLLSAVRLCDPILHDIVVMLLGFVLCYWRLFFPEGHHFQMPVSHQAAWHIWYTGTKSLRKYKIGVLIFSELRIRESVAGNGYHKARRIKTRLITDPW